jgi:hypothetical protein
MKHGKENTMKELDLQVEETFLPIFAKHGFDKVSRSYRRLPDCAGVTNRKELLSLTFKGPDEGFGQPAIEIYVADMYTNERGEIKFYCWQSAGLSTKGFDVRRWLACEGIASRSTKHKGNNAIAVVWEASWD